VVAAIGLGTVPASAAPSGPVAADLAPAAPAPALPAGMKADEQAAVNAVDGYWRKHFTEVFGKPYRSPKVAGGYVGRDGPACNGKAPIPFNAFYCRPGDFLAWDENLMSAGYNQVGDSWVYLVIAHEWGHAIQNRVKGRSGTKSVELQADCLAGATLQGAARDGLVQIEDGDDEELARTLAASADDYPWTDEGDHGDARQRIGAFNIGAQKGAKACF
jgi:hypothetical protein